LVGLPDEECQSETDGDGETGSRVHARYYEPPNKCGCLTHALGK
jgi:hypothetical protein